MSLSELVVLLAILWPILPDLSKDKKLIGKKMAKNSDDGPNNTRNKYKAQDKSEFIR